MTDDSSNATPKGTNSKITRISGELRESVHMASADSKDSKSSGKGSKSDSK